MELRVEEINLVLLIRTKHRYGEIIIKTHDGIPQSIKKVEVFNDLHGKLDQPLKNLINDSYGKE